MFFQADSALDRSKDMRRHRQQDLKGSKGVEPKTVDEYGDAIAVNDVTTGGSEEETADGEPLDLAQLAIWSSLSDEIRALKGRLFPFKNAADLWDHLHEEYGTPNLVDIRRAQRALFPLGLWEEGEDIIRNIVEQRRAAVVFDAAGIPFSDVLVRMQHLRYLPRSFGDDPAISRLIYEDPHKLQTHLIFEAIEQHLEHFASPKRLNRCYYHNTDKHKVSQCREIRSLMRQVRKRKGKSSGDKAEDDKAVDRIFERYIGRVWRCKEHGASDHHDEWCAVQLKKRLR
jgi:hypothetical protein